MEKLAVYVALTLSILVAALGAVTLVRPETIWDLMQFIRTPSALFISAGVRIIFGVALFYAARISRAPTILHALGGIVIFSGIMMPLLGVDGYRGLVELKMALGSGRVWAIAAVVSGALLTYALVYPFVPKSRVV